MMHARRATLTLAALLCTSALALAQDAQAPRAVGGVNITSGQQPPATATAPTAPTLPTPRFAPPRPQGQLVNVKVEFTITDQLGSRPPVKKTMTMVVADKESSRIRTNVEYNYPLTTLNDKGEVVRRGGVNRGTAPLSVDVSPAIEGNKVRLEFSIEYSTTDADAGGGPDNKTTVSERLAVILESGIPLIVAQSSDAYSDRKITVEIKAMILK